jgi:hypothetical protein
VGSRGGGQSAHKYMYTNKLKTDTAAPPHHSHRNEALGLSKPFFDADVLGDGLRRHIAGNGMSVPVVGSLSMYVLAKLQLTT